MVNKVTLIGNLGSDPDTRETKSGDAVVNFRMATSWRGSGEEVTTWHNVVAFGKLAANVGKFMKKGSKVYVDGRISERTYEKDGATKYITEIVANDIRFLDPPGAAKEKGHPFEGF